MIRSSFGMILQWGCLMLIPSLYNLDGLFLFILHFHRRHSRLARSQRRENYKKMWEDHFYDDGKIESSLHLYTILTISFYFILHLYGVTRDCSKPVRQRLQKDLGG
ncbi:hypothetical protein B0H63DRAFT_463303 [Podospora didyma]|uniref:Uncharacterized protein n=1 Tax=Podospora didyma TaxID=330526 RepID=A0AAE0U3A0_9PEZI|nr:hypothetical protein B0H63DRAFT_463303 [Podospora didyma]